MTDKRTSTRGPAAIAVVLVLAFVGAGVAADSNEGTPGGAATASVTREVDTIARRVEELRDLRFREAPEPVVVTPEETREMALEDLDRHYPPERRRADQTLLVLLGLVPPDIDLRAVAGDVSGGQVAGFYDPRRDRLAVVSGDAASSNRTVAEITLAHELVHALEDQRFGIEEPEQGADDRATAYTALVEGTATAVMSDYIRRHVSTGDALSTAVSALGPSSEAARSIPPYLQRSIEFSYTGGERFVRALVTAARGWKLVNVALTERPPVSSEQILHPLKYIRFERPRRVPIGDLGLGDGWERAARGTIGEFDTRELLRVGLDIVPAVNAAEGWGGGGYELWTNTEAVEGCAPPCRAANVLVLRWSWDSDGDAREFEGALPRYLSEGLGAEPAGDGRWRVDGGGAAVAATGGSATLAFAPSPDEAARLAASAGR